MERRIGEIFEYNGEWYQCIKADPIIGADGIINYCERCAMSASECDNFYCTDDERSDKELVVFEKLEKVGEPFTVGRKLCQHYKVFDINNICGNVSWNVHDYKTKTIVIEIKQNEIMEVKIQIPDNCELIKDGDAYIVKEKKQKSPKSWEEFCEKFPIKQEECFIDYNGEILSATVLNGCYRRESEDRNLCINKEEAKAFLALIQLCQLRKAWVGDWEQPNSNFLTAAILYSVNKQKVIVDCGNYWALNILSFPTKRMAEEFLECFKDLCETAKVLL